VIGCGGRRGTKCLWVAAAAASNKVIKTYMSIYNIYGCQDGLPYPAYLGLVLSKIKLYQVGLKSLFIYGLKKNYMTLYGPWAKWVSLNYFNFLKTL